jgi:hydroxymethylpyrimidine/phosphomethylpyrimidine kinase
LRTALSIAGSDSGGGAGIQADLKTFTAYGVYGMSVITAVTAQNSTGVFAVAEVDPLVITAQCEAVFRDFPVHAVKVGMLSSVEAVEAVGDVLSREKKPALVLDPVITAKSGASLLRSDALRLLADKLFPRALLITPNIPEAEAFTGLSVSDEAGMKEAARRLSSLGAQNVLVKGGHLAGSRESCDLFYDGHEFFFLISPRLSTLHTHGTGCTLSSAVAAGIALGLSLLQAVRMAKHYITEAIREAPGLGNGAGPVNHFVSPFGEGTPRNTKGDILER